MDFSQALRNLKSGFKVSRSGWNGKRMFIVAQKGYPNGIAINKNTAEATGLVEGTVCKFSPYLMIMDALDNFAPWAPSQADIFAEDWEIVS